MWITHELGALKGLDSHDRCTPSWHLRTRRQCGTDHGRLKYPSLDEVRTRVQVLASKFDRKICRQCALWCGSVDRMTNSLTTIEAVAHAVSDAHAQADALRAIRDSFILDALNHGSRQADIARATGLSPSAIRKIDREHLPDSEGPSSDTWTEAAAGLQAALGDVYTQIAEIHSEEAAWTGAQARAVADLDLAGLRVTIEWMELLSRSEDR